MDMKEYLEQAHSIERLIDSKLVMIEELEVTATKCTQALSDMPKGGGGGGMENAVAKIADLKNEIADMLAELIDLKKDILETIAKVKNSEYRAILEMRYLSRMTWESIGIELGFTIHHLIRKHNKAIKLLEQVNQSQ